MRKEKDFDITDRIKLYYSGDIKNAISKYDEYIKKETLSLEIIEDNNIESSFDLNGIEVKLDVERVIK